MLGFPPSMAKGSLTPPCHGLLTLGVQEVAHKKVVLELQVDGKLTTSDDPPIVFGCLEQGFMQKTGSQPGNLLRFSINDGGLAFVGGKLEKADLVYQDKPNRARAFADSYSKVVFQYMARRAPLRIDDLLASVNSPIDQEDKPCDVEMSG
uniref:Uncharacterized protein n=1 Tax=Opuntia streptacantha TaxID=393608 RepID=A0A7C9E2P4_OPUST